MAWDIYNRTLDIKFQRDQSIGLGSTIGATVTDTHRQFFLKHIFRLWEWCSIKKSSKSEVKLFDDCTIPPSLLMSLEKKKWTTKPRILDNNYTTFARTISWGNAAT